MKNKKEFFGVLFSVLICVLVVFAGVYAATTIGNNITAGGTIAINGSAHDTELSVIGTASISEDLWASGSFQFAGGEGTATVSYSRLGSTTTGHSLADADDLLIGGLLEVDDAVYFDSTASIATSLVVPYIVGNMDAGEYLRIGDTGTTGHSLAANDDLLIGGKLEVDGTAYFDGVASISEMDFSSGLVTADVLQAGSGTTSVSYSRFGSSTTTNSQMDAADDVLISGELEVDATSYFDGLVSVSDANGLQIGGGSTIFGDSASPSGSCTKGDVHINSAANSGTGANRIISVCDVTNEWSAIDAQ